MTPFEQVLHQEKQLSTPDDKHKGKEIQRSKQTRWLISFKKGLLSGEPFFQTLAKQHLFFIPASQQRFFGDHWIEI